MHGVKKVLDAGKASAGGAALSAASGAAGSGGNASSSPASNALLERAFIFLEDGDWKQADEYCERVLDADPKNARAYIGKLCAELHVRQEADLPNTVKVTADKKTDYPDVHKLLIAGEKNEAIKLYARQTNASLSDAKEYVESLPVSEVDKTAVNSLKGYGNYDKALRFADPAYRAVIEGYEQVIQERAKEERERRAESVREAKHGREYTDILTVIEQSRQYPLSASEMNMEYIRSLRQAARKLRNMEGYKDSSSLAGECDQIAAAGTQILYERLLSDKETAAGYDVFIALSGRFRELEGYKDSKDMEDECFRIAYEIKEKERLEKLEEKYMLVLSAKSKLNEFDSVSSSKLTVLANACKELEDYKDSGDLERELRCMAAEALEKEREAERAAKFEEPYNELVKEKELHIKVKSMQPGMFEDLAKRFRKMDGYKDSGKYADECALIALEQRNQQNTWRTQGLCIMCGGQIGGLRTKKCKSCGYEPRR